MNINDKNIKKRPAKEINTLPFSSPEEECCDIFKRVKKMEPSFESGLKRSND